MDQKEEMSEKEQNKKEDTSDRESSVESFYTNKSEVSIATESELINVDDIELSDEESWLYMSPKNLPPADKALSTYKSPEEARHLPKSKLSSTKDALVNKIAQLKLQGLSKPSCTNKTYQLCDEIDGSVETKVNVNESPQKNCKQNSLMGKENEVLDVTDVCKIAQLQEENKRSLQEKKKFLKENAKLNKPASVEDLNHYYGEGAYKSVSLHQIQKQNSFNSDSSLNNEQECHHGSLPDINPGFYSLKAKKPRKSSDHRLPCPLPIYPTVASRLVQSGSASDVSTHESQAKHLTSPTSQEYRTLPSSYRSHSLSRRNSSLSSPRRESPTTFLPSPRNTASLTRRDSAPNANGASKYCTSPLSSPTLYQRSRGISSPVLRSPTMCRRNPPKDLKTMPNYSEYQRNGSHSPSRRLPLTTVHNRSPKRSPASPCNEDLRNCKLQSKIPSPGSPLRSGIPVPSSFASKINSDDESWSNDCY